MAEWGEKGPFFYHGFFGHKSVLTQDMSSDQRIEYRVLYKKVVRRFPKNYEGRMKARSVVRGMLYSELGIKGRTS